MACADVDCQSLALIIELQLNDIESLLKGKHKEGDVEDTESAMEAYKCELESLAMLESDRAMCRSIARAVEQDGDVVAEHARVEEEAARDRQQALGTGSVSSMAENAREQNMLDDELLAKLRSLYMGGGESDACSEDAEGESSTWAASRTNKAGPRGTRRQCLACTEWVPFFDIARAPCSHEYCRQCLEVLFRNAIQDESYYPPRCCKQPIPVGTNQIFLPSQLITEFRTKELEYGTSDRTYCHQPACSAFIAPERIEDNCARCPNCTRRTCSVCKEEYHTSKACPQDHDVATLELLRVADEQGWQQCPECHRIVELTTGCFHMTCPCGAEFCYLCAAPMPGAVKTCTCPTSDETFLRGRAEDIVNRDLPFWGSRANLAEREELVQREMRNQLENHGCAHLRWFGRRGGHACEECRKIMPEFIYECRQCRILACRRCRYNRL